LQQKSFRGLLGKGLPRQGSVDLHQKSSAQELAQVDRQQKNLFRQPAESFRLLRKSVLQQNKSAGYPGRVALMRMNGVLHQKNSSGLQDGLFYCK
jgi:hypothetical protein